MSDTVGVQLAPGRFVDARRRRCGGSSTTPPLLASVLDLADVLREAIGPVRRPAPAGAVPDEVQDALAEARVRLDRVSAALVAIQTPVEDAKQRKLRAQLVIGRAIEHLDLALQRARRLRRLRLGPPEHPRLEIAPLDVGPALRDGVWAEKVAVLTSATIPTSLPARLGLPPARTDVADVGSPFDYAHQGLLYCAMHLPDPRDDGYRDAVHDELVALITAAGGRTLALFTSYKAMDLAAAAVRERVDVPILTQRDLPKPALVGPLRRRRGDVRVRHRRVLPGHRRARAHAEPGRRRPAAVPAPRRPAAVGPPRGLGAGRVQRDRRAAGGDDAGPGGRPADPHGHRSRRRRRARPPPRHGPLPLGRSCRRCRRCAAPASGPTSRRSCATLDA